MGIHNLHIIISHAFTTRADGGPGFKAPFKESCDLAVAKLLCSRDQVGAPGPALHHPPPRGAFNPVQLFLLAFMSTVPSSNCIEAGSSMCQF